MSLFILIIIVLVHHDKKKHESQKIGPLVDYIKRYSAQGYKKEQIQRALIKSRYKNKEIELAFKKAK